jgi:hypothetical protein
LFRNVYGGVVVYDNKARLVGHDVIGKTECPDEDTFTKKRGPLGCNEISDDEEVLNREPTEKDFATEHERHLYENLSKMPRRKCHKVDHTIQIPNYPDILQFESRFENGNLKKAIMVNIHEYNLILENDVNTKGHTQWFYFTIKT